MGTPQGEEHPGPLLTLCRAILSVWLLTSRLPQNGFWSFSCEIHLLGRKKEERGKATSISHVSAAPGGGVVMAQKRGAGVGLRLVPVRTALGLSLRYLWLLCHEHQWRQHSSLHPEDRHQPQQSLQNLPSPAHVRDQGPRPCECRISFLGLEGAVLM